MSDILLTEKIIISKTFTFRHIQVSIYLNKILYLKTTMDFYKKAPRVIFYI